MGTGQKTIQKINKNLEKEVSLSIQVSLSGLSFFVLNLTTSNIEYLDSINFDKH